MVYCAATGSQYQVYMKLCLVYSCSLLSGVPPAEKDRAFRCTLASLALSTPNAGAGAMTGFLLLRN
jgi:hypothetical protein